MFTPSFSYSSADALVSKTHASRGCIIQPHKNSHAAKYNQKWKSLLVHYTKGTQPIATKFSTNSILRMYYTAFIAERARKINMRAWLG